MESSSWWGKGARHNNADDGKTILLNVAIDCLVKRGVRSTTMQDIAEAAHVSRRTVYRYFSGKEEMLREVVYYSQDLAFKSIYDAARKHSDNFFDYFEEAVVAGVKYYVATDSEVHAVASNNKQEIGRFLEHEFLVDKWTSLLRGPYIKYITRRPEAKDEGMLKNYAELATLLVTGHCQLRSTDSRVRESFKNMMALAHSGEKKQ